MPIQTRSPRLHAQAIREIAAVALCDIKTVRRAYGAGRTRPVTIERVRRAAATLGLPGPQAPTP